MNFFGYIPVNVVIAQIIEGIWIGMCFGICIPSEYEKIQSIENRQKIWFWKIHQMFDIKDIFIYLLKVLLIICFVGFIDIKILQLLNVYPMSKYANHSIIMLVAFIVITFTAKYVRYLYFRYKLDKILENEIHK